MKFKVGDKVRVTNTLCSYEGQVGTVLEADRIARGIGGYDYKVRFDDFMEIPYGDDEIELVTPETPKASSKFYVSVVTEGRTFDTLEAAEMYAKERAAQCQNDTYAIYQPLKAFKVSIEPQEVTLA